MDRRNLRPKNSVRDQCWEKTEEFRDDAHCPLTVYVLPSSGERDFFERTTRRVCNFSAASNFPTSSKVVPLKNRTHDNARQKQRSHTMRAEPFCRHIPARKCEQITRNVTLLKQLTTLVRWRHKVPPPRIWTRLAFCEHLFPKHV